MCCPLPFADGKLALFTRAGLFLTPVDARAVLAYSPGDQPLDEAEGETALNPC